jgi:hypothetical protein
MVAATSKQSETGTSTQPTPLASNYGTPKEENPPHPSIQGQDMDIDAKDTDYGSHFPIKMPSMLRSTSLQV